MTNLLKENIKIGAYITSVLFHLTTVQLGVDHSISWEGGGVSDPKKNFMQEIERENKIPACA